MGEVEHERATSLHYIANNGSPNLINALERRKNYGRKRDVSSKYRARMTFTQLKCVSILSRYNSKNSRWEDHLQPREPKELVGRSGFAVGLSRDSSYLVFLRGTSVRNVATMYFLLLSPEFAAHTNQMLIREFTKRTKFRMYFHPSNRFISVFVYNQSQFESALMNGRSEASVFHVHTLIPQHSLCFRYTTSATLVCREKPKDPPSMTKHYLRLHSNGFILNTGVTMSVFVFSDTVPARMKYKQKIWRVILQQTSPFYDNQPHSITCELGEEIAVESSIRCESGRMGLPYKLVDCDKEQYCDPNFPCGLRKPLFITRHVVCIESLIDRLVGVYMRTSGFFKGAVYRGIIDYEADVNRVSKSGICNLVILCVTEIQVPVGKSKITRNSFYLFQIQVLWSVFRGWKVGGNTQLIKELKPEIAYSPNSWYPYKWFPLEKDEYTYFIPNGKLVLGKGQSRIISPDETMEVVLDLNRALIS